MTAVFPQKGLVHQSQQGKQPCHQRQFECSGYSINRQSESLGGEFFYSAKYYPNLDYIIRSALPYNVSLMRHLKADSHYVWFTLIISLILIIVCKAGQTHRFPGKCEAVL